MDETNFYPNTCRACMLKSASLQKLFTNEHDTVPLADMLNAISLLNITPCDGLPNQICTACTDLLVQAYGFQRMCIESDAELRAVIDSKKETNIQISSDQIKFDNIEHLDPEEYLEADNDLPKNETLPSEDEQEENVAEISNEANENAKVEEKLPTKNSGKRKRRIQCEICDKPFKDNTHLQRHRSVHDPLKRPFECDICKIRFTKENNLRRHLTIHSDYMTNSVARQKNETAETLENSDKEEALSPMYQQAKTKKAKRQHTCQLCSKVFRSPYHLTRHFKSHPQFRAFECDLCKKRFEKNTQLIDHVNRHNGIKPFLCHICDKAYYQSAGLSVHLKTHTIGMEFLCSECGKSFTNKYCFKQHLSRHNDKEIFACDECPKRFKCKANLSSHKTIHLNRKPFQCDICGSSYTKSHSLKKHKLTHTGERPYGCDYCSMRFTSSSHTKRHMRTHTGEKPYSCKYCERSFTQSNDLVKHTRSHIGEKIYRCDRCPEAFRLQTELRLHVQEHFKRGELESNSDVKSISNDDSSSAKVVTESNDQLVETGSHIDEKTYRCDRCPEAFRLETELRSHVYEHFERGKLNLDEKSSSNDDSSSIKIVDNVVYDLSIPY